MTQLRKVLLATATACAVAASASAQNNGDLLLGFTGGSSDFIYDLGQYSTLSLGQTWNVGANLGTQFGVVGYQNAGSHIYSTSSDAAQNGFDPTGLFTFTRADVVTLAGGLTVGGSRTPTAADTSGWTYQTAQPAGTPGKSFQNDFFNPNVGIGATAYLFDNANSGTVTPLDVFTYDSSSGILSYQVVPEPSTLSLLALMGLVRFGIRRQQVRRGQ